MSRRRVYAHPGYGKIVLAEMKETEEALRNLFRRCHGAEGDRRLDSALRAIGSRLSDPIIECPNEQNPGA